MYVLRMLDWFFDVEERRVRRDGCGFSKKFMLFFLLCGVMV